MLVVISLLESLMPIDDQGTKELVGSWEAEEIEVIPQPEPSSGQGKRKETSRGSVWNWSDHGWSFREKSALINFVFTQSKSKEKTADILKKKWATLSLSF